MDKRQEIRALHKKLREDMAPEEVKEKSSAINRRILESDWYKNCRILYAYYPLGKEADCRKVIVQALSEDKIVALPRTMADCRMEFYRIASIDDVQEGRFHVMEPSENCPLLKEQKAAVLVPGVVFDRQGSRYGYGRGYYDRYFARFGKLRRIGLCYENQMEEKIKTMTTDIRMEYIYTENEVYRFEPETCILQ